MSGFKHYRPSLSVLLVLGLLVLCSLSFQWQPWSYWLESKGIKFVKVADLSLKKDKKSTFKPAKRMIAEVPASVKNLGHTDQKSIDTLKSRVHFLENFVTGDGTTLDYFFNSLSQTAEQSVHIWYYGDSQIEGDRLTGELRQFFQSKFGGFGVGYTPFADVASYRYFELKPSASLKKYNCFVNKVSMGFGFAGKTYAFNLNDSQLNTSTSLIISPSLRYNRWYLLLGKNSGGIIKIHHDTSLYEMAIPESTTAQRLLIPYTLKGKVRLELPLNGKYSGFSFDSDKGIQIDNCGIRGHSGDGLRFISNEVIQSEAKTWNTKLVIFHFGNNMIPVIKGDKASMDYYMRYFKGIFSRYKKLMPGVSFLVISAGDMGTIIDGEETGYPNLPQFTEAMRTAALQSGCAFFDAHSMIQKGGGILGWKKKGYAGLDGHLTGAGQLKFAATIYSEMMREYDIYKIIHSQP